MRRIGQQGIGSVLIALAVLVGASVAAPSPADAAERCAATAPAGSVRVVVVIDYGVEDGAPSPASVECLTVAAGTSGGELLAARSALLGAAKLRFAGSGLLCAIDGYPAAPECGQASGDEYRYWSYWSGTGGAWVYGAGNPFVRRVQDGDIEGWRFSSAAESEAPAPRPAPDPAELFPAAPPDHPPAGPDEAVAPQTPASDGERPASDAGAPPPTTSDPGVADTTPADPARVVAAGPAAAGVGEDVAATSVETASADGDGQSTSVPGATLIGAGVVTALAAAATWAFRRRTWSVGS